MRYIMVIGLILVYALAMVAARTADSRQEVTRNYCRLALSSASTMRDTLRVLDSALATGRECATFLRDARAVCPP